MKTESKSKEGIVVGLIDCITSISRALSPLLKKFHDDELTPEILHALQDLTQDEDVLFVLRACNSRYIISEERALIFEKIISEAKSTKIII